MRASRGAQENPVSGDAALIGREGTQSEPVLHGTGNRRITVERETTTPRTDDARKAFDDLFKF